MDVGSGNAEIFGHRIEFVGGVGQLRQRLREPRAIDAGAAPEFGIGDARHAARCRLGRAAPVAGCLRRIEQRIAKAGHRLDVLVTPRKCPQRLQAGDRRQHRYRMTLQQPCGIAIAVEFVRDRHARLLGHQQMKRQRRQRARRHDQQTALVLDQRLDRRRAASRKARWRAPDRTGRILPEASLAFAISRPRRNAAIFSDSASAPIGIGFQSKLSRVMAKT